MKGTLTKRQFLTRRSAFTLNCVLVLGLFLSLSSCRSYQEIPYFQDLTRKSVTQEQINNYSPLIIQPNDIIGVNVMSLNADASAAFNLRVTVLFFG